MKNKTKKTLKDLEKELENMKSYHGDIWNTYGSELCAGDMIRKEEKLEKEIAKLKNEDEEDDVPFYSEDPSQIVDN